jgi:hypothetical protein
MQEDALIITAFKMDLTTHQSMNSQKSTLMPSHLDPSNNLQSKKVVWSLQIQSPQHSPLRPVQGKKQPRVQPPSPYNQILEEQPVDEVAPMGEDLLDKSLDTNKKIVDADVAEEGEAEVGNEKKEEAENGLVNNVLF